MKLKDSNMQGLLVYEYQLNNFKHSNNEIKTYHHSFISQPI